MQKKNFTLIELITVVAILGILASIIIPNFSDMKGKSIQAGIQSNVRTLQTSVDLYALDHNNDYPTKFVPTIDNPQIIDFNELYPKYMTKIPKEWKTEKYWVDVWGKVWGSTIDAPSNVHLIQSGGQLESLSWENQSQKVGYSVGYEVYNVDQFKTTQGAVRPSKTHWKISNLFTPQPTTKIINYRMQNKQQPYTLVSATDMYGLATPPVGEGYTGYPDFIEIENGSKPESPYFPEVPDTFPITDVGTYYVTTNAHGLATWLGITKSEVKPAGTDIKYSFATDSGTAAGAVNNKKCGAFGAYSDDITKLPKSQCMKVKIELIGTEEVQPTLNSLKVIFNVSDEESADDETITNHTPQNPPTWNPGDTTHTQTEIIDLPGSDKVTDIKPIVTLPPGTSSDTNYSTHNPDTGEWSKPTPYPEQLPPGDQVKQETTLTKDDPKAENPKLEETIVSSRPPHANEQQPEQPGTEEMPVDEWLTIDSMDLQFDAGQKGNWISAEITDNQPEGTRIIYEYSTSDNGVTWSSKTEDIAKAADSQFIKVDITRQHKNDVQTKPKFIQIVINYELGDGTKKSVTLVNNQIQEEIQKAVDQYKADKGNYPSTTQPSKNGSQPIDFSKLVPTYLDSIPPTNGINYSVDFTGKVWISSLNPPTLSAADTTLNWNAVSGSTKYNVYKLSGSKWTLVTSTTSTTYANATRGEEYAVTAVDSMKRESAPSNVVAISSIAGPEAATITAGTPADNGVTLTIAVTGTVDSIELYRNGSLYKTLTGTTTSYKDTGLVANTNYSYYIVAKNSAGTKQSNTVNVAIPAAPTAVAISSTAKTDKTITLNVTGGTGATTYTLYRNGSAKSWSAGSNVDTGLTGNTTYSYYVVAKNAGGSTTSSTISVTTNISAPVVTTYSVAIGGITNAVMWWTEVGNKVEVYRNNALIYTRPANSAGDGYFVFYDRNPAMGTNSYYIKISNSAGTATSTTETGTNSKTMLPNQITPTGSTYGNIEFQLSTTVNGLTGSVSKIIAHYGSSTQQLSAGTFRWSPPGQFDEKSGIYQKTPTNTYWVEWCNSSNQCVSSNSYTW